MGARPGISGARSAAPAPRSCLSPPRRTPAATARSSGSPGFARASTSLARPLLHHLAEHRFTLHGLEVVVTVDGCVEAAKRAEFTVWAGADAPDLIWVQANMTVEQLVGEMGDSRP